MDMVTIDVGCGRNPLPGAIGLDFSMAGSQSVTLDLNKDPFPFASDSVDFVFSSHALEHLTYDGFFHVIKEIYRVTKPDGQIFIKVPYFSGQINLANPFHNNQIAFNEHTFRFFSSEPETKALDPGAYLTPSCRTWGLRYSANSELGVELRTERIDFIYFPEFEHLEEEELAVARRKSLGVVENIHYHLRPVKPCPKTLTRNTTSFDYHSAINEMFGVAAANVQWLENEGTRLKHLVATRHVLGPVEISILKQGFLAMERVRRAEFERINNLYLSSSDKLIYPPDEVLRLTEGMVRSTRHLIDLLVRLEERRNKAPLRRNLRALRRAPRRLVTRLKRFLVLTGYQ